MYDDNDEIELEIEPHRLRRLEEMRRMGKDGARVKGPDWNRRAVRPVVGARIAVYGHHRSQVLDVVIRLLGGALDNMYWQ